MRPSILQRPDWVTRCPSHPRLLPHPPQSPPASPTRSPAARRHARPYPAEIAPLLALAHPAELTDTRLSRLPPRPAPQAPSRPHAPPPGSAPAPAPARPAPAPAPPRREAEAPAGRGMRSPASGPGLRAAALRPRGNGPARRAGAGRRGGRGPPGAPGPEPHRQLLLPLHELRQLPPGVRDLRRRRLVVHRHVGLRQAAARRAWGGPCAPPPARGRPRRIAPARRLPGPRRAARWASGSRASQKGPRWWRSALGPR